MELDITTLLMGALLSINVVQIFVTSSVTPPAWEPVILQPHARVCLPVVSGDVCRSPEPWGELHVVYPLPKGAWPPLVGQPVVAPVIIAVIVPIAPSVVSLARAALVAVVAAVVVAVVIGNSAVGLDSVAGVAVGPETLLDHRATGLLTATLVS